MPINSTIITHSTLNLMTQLEIFSIWQSLASFQEITSTIISYFNNSCSLNVFFCPFQPRPTESSQIFTQRPTLFNKTRPEIKDRQISRHLSLSLFLSLTLSLSLFSIDPWKHVMNASKESPPPPFSSPQRFQTERVSHRTRIPPLTPLRAMKVVL